MYFTRFSLYKKIKMYSVSMLLNRFTSKDNISRPKSV